MTHKVTLIPGDGIGPEVMPAAVRILEATGVKFEWESFAAGADALREVPRVHSEGADRIHRAHARWAERAGHHADRRRLLQHQRALRKQFELYANFRPIRNLPHFPRAIPTST